MMGRKLFKGMAKAFFLMAVIVFFVNGTDVDAQTTSKKDVFREEKNYIEQKKEIKVAIVDGYLPISSKKGKKGYRGYVVDILEQFAKETGLKIRYLDADSYHKAIEMTETDKADVAAVAVRYPYGKKKNRTEVTNPYLIAQMMVIHNKNTTLDRLPKYDVAEVEGYPEFTDNPKIFHRRFKTRRDCILAVRAGHADMMYCDIFTGMASIRRYENRDLVSIPINQEIEFRFGISPKANPVLKQMLNRTIKNLSRKEINQSLTNNRLESEGRITDFIYYYLFEIICAVFMTGFLIVVVFYVYTRIKMRRTIALHGYTKSYCMLADALGEPGFHYDYMEDKMTVFGKYGYKLSMPSEINNFSSYLDSDDKEISLTKEQFRQILEEGMKGTSCDADLKCKIKGEGWHHFRLMFSVISTEESYGRPVSMIGCLTDTEANYKEKEKLLRLGMYDKVTGLFNRDGAEQEIKKHLEESVGIGQDILLMIDVDLFKTFNDVHGHKCGDDVLREMGQHLKRIFRKEDIACRWGGDEFLLYLIGTASHIETVVQRCEDLKKVMKEYQYEGKSLPVTLSIGGAVVIDKSLDETFELADQVLYSIKEKGRDSVEILV